MSNKPQLKQIIKAVCKHIGDNTKAQMIRIPFQDDDNMERWTDCPLSKQALEDKGMYGMYEAWFSTTAYRSPNESWDFTIRVAMDFATDTCQVLVIIPENGDDWAKKLASYRKSTAERALKTIGGINDDVVAELVRYFPAIKKAGKHYTAPFSDDDS